jgi:cysteine desulfurase
VPHFYFDHNATSPVAESVLTELQRELAEVYGNASSIHYFGQAAKQRFEAARRQVASLLGCDPKEIVFTSGGTESDNLAISGVAGEGHIITSQIEHPAVLNTSAHRERAGNAVTWLPVDREGRVDPDDVRRAVRPETALISVMHSNNETGVVQPIEEIAAIGREAGVLVHCDAVQTVGRMSVNVRELGLSLLSLSGHKFGAPKGVGALYVKSGVSVEPLLFGGRHERERRAGTENVPGAVALGVAATLGTDNWTSLAALRDRLERSVLQRVPGATVNGAEAARVANTSSIRFDGVEGEAMVIALDLRGFAVSSGSACSSGAVEPSHVLLAMGLSREDARSSVRFSLGPGNTAEQVEALVEAVAESAAHLRRISPQVVAHA